MHFLLLLYLVVANKFLPLAKHPCKCIQKSLPFFRPGLTAGKDVHQFHHKVALQYIEE